MSMNYALTAARFYDEEVAFVLVWLYRLGKACGVAGSPSPLFTRVERVVRRSSVRAVTTCVSQQVTRRERLP